MNPEPQKYVVGHGTPEASTISEHDEDKPRYLLVEQESFDVFIKLVRETGIALTAGKLDRYWRGFWMGSFFGGIVGPPVYQAIKWLLG